jgi:hypothetical protein
MVSNIGKFTSNQIPLEQAVTAMQGIATWAAISGQNAGSASRAMYNLSQAIGVGSVKLMDWRSIENANMATAEFKQKVIEVAVAQGQLKEVSEGVYETLEGHEVTVKNFTQNLSDNWFSSDVLLATLDQYGAVTDALYKFSDASGLTATEILDLVATNKSLMLSHEELAQKAEETGVSIDELREANNQCHISEEELKKISEETGMSVEDLKKFRIEVEDLRHEYSLLELAMKLLGNGLYGCCANRFFYFYNVYLAGDITGECRNLTKTMWNNLENFFHETLWERKDLWERFDFELDESKHDWYRTQTISCYSDTDSVYATYGTLFKCMTPKYQEKYKENLHNLQLIAYDCYLNKNFPQHNSLL